MIAFEHISPLYEHPIAAKEPDMVDDMLPCLMSFLTAAFFTAIGLFLVLKACYYFKLYDLPDERKIHHTPVPRLGGIVFMPATILGLCAALYLLEGSDKHFVISISTPIMAVGAFIIYLIGLADDRFGMKASHKFIIQGISALFMPLCGLLITNLYGILGIYEIPVWVGYPLTVLLIMTIINAINLIDGIDGLASGLCILILSAYAYLFLNSNYPIIAAANAAIVGALCTFFCFNFFGKIGGKKIFMGDAGSLFLGYVCAYMSIKSLMCPITLTGQDKEEILVPLTLLFIPVIDVVRVALQRYFTNHGIFEPDKTHIHHLFMAAGLSMHQTLLAIIVLFLGLCTINYALWQRECPLEIILLIDTIIYVLLATTILRLDRKSAH